MSKEDIAVTSVLATIGAACIAVFMYLMYKEGETDQRKATCDKLTGVLVDRKYCLPKGTFIDLSGESDVK